MKRHDRVRCLLARTVTHVTGSGGRSGDQSSVPTTGHAFPVDNGSVDSRRVIVKVTLTRRS
jgi:hypothetical protein